MFQRWGRWGGEKRDSVLAQRKTQQGVKWYHVTPVSPTNISGRRHMEEFSFASTLFTLFERHIYLHTLVVVVDGGETGQVA